MISTKESKQEPQGPWIEEKLDIANIMVSLFKPFPIVINKNEVMHVYASGEFQWNATPIQQKVPRFILIGNDKMNKEWEKIAFIKDFLCLDYV